jgi:flavin reductase (DIM6/NTAB) family NADH-FMN oxidoreductase RutF
MTHADIRASHVFYICPRPVVLVTVEHQGTGNMFPMDLIGPTGSPWFSIALRLTSPAVDLMRQSRRLALASVPISYKDIAYKLGEHHRKVRIDWDSLPFRVQRSSQFGLPVAQAALRVREVRIEECHPVGSHMLFLTAPVSDTRRDPPVGKQLFHAFYGTNRPPMNVDEPASTRSATPQYSRGPTSRE